MSTATSLKTTFMGSSKMKRKCIKCRHFKCLKAFPWKSRVAGVRHRKCKLCVRKYSNNRWRKRAAELQVKNRLCRRASVRRNLDGLFAYLLRHPCVDCGEPDPIVLCCDHVRGVKRKAVSAMVTQGFSWENIELELEKCAVHCANCHTRKTAKQFGWRRQYCGHAFQAN
jgi:hypothetical protein